MALTTCFQVASLVFLLQLVLASCSQDQKETCLYELLEKNAPKDTKNDGDTLQDGELVEFSFSKYDIEIVCIDGERNITEAGVLTLDEKEEEGGDEKLSRVKRAWGKPWSRPSSSRRRTSRRRTSRRRTSRWGGSRRRTVSRSGGSGSSRRRSTYRRIGSFGESSSQKKTSSSSGGWPSNRRKSTNKRTEKMWDRVHSTLDVIGLIPKVGNVADLVNAGLHLARGNIKEAGLSALGAIPGKGLAVTASKLVKKAKNVKWISKSKPLGKIAKTLEAVSETKKTKKLLDSVEKIHKVDGAVKKIGKAVDAFTPDKKDEKATS